MVYTDKVHLIADTLEELHRFARKIGMKAEWFQDTRIPHYDLLKGKSKVAIAKGAKVVTSRDIIRLAGESDDKRNN